MVLVVAVVAATTATFVGLRAAFDTDRRKIGDTSDLPTNGEIVFSREGEDGRLHLFAVQPDGSGLRQITEGATDDSDAAVSPDGGTIAYVRASDESGRHLATVPIEGGDVVELADAISMDDPAWSPDGTEIALVFSGIDSILLGIVDTNGRLTRSLLDVLTSLARPSWSPDGSRIAIGVVPQGSGGSVGIISSDGPTDRPLRTTLGVGRSPAWSPDGSRIALIRSGDRGDEIWVIAPDGSHEELLASAIGARLEPDLTWAPDGGSLLVSDGDWIYRIDAISASDPRENFVQLVLGHSPAWQSLRTGGMPSTTSPEPEGRDVGMGFFVCQVSEIEGQFDGEGDTDTAIVATRVGDDMRCPSNVDESRGYVGIDLDDDGLADHVYGPITCEASHCRVFAAPDLDGDSGRHELLIVEGGGSPLGLGVYALGSPASDRAGIVHVEIGEPDLPLAGFVAGEPARLSIGDNEAWSYRLRCEDHPAGRFLYVSRAYHQFEGSGPWTVDETTLVFAELRLTVFDAREPELSTSDDPLGPQPEELCGAPIPQV